MQSITPMRAYATSDGNLYTDRIEAQARQHGLNIKQEVQEYLGFDPQDLPAYHDSHTTYKIMTIIDWEVAKKLKELKGAADAAQ